MSERDFARMIVAILMMAPEHKIVISAEAQTDALDDKHSFSVMESFDTRNITLSLVDLSADKHVS